MPRGDGPFKVLARINDNAYKIELPDDYYGVSNTFNVADLSPFFGHEETESRSTPFQEGEDDEDTPHDVQDSDVYKGPLTRTRAQLLQHEVNLVINECDHSSTKNYLLPNGSTLLVLTTQVPRGGHGKSVQVLEEQAAVPVMVPDSVPNVRQELYQSRKLHHKYPTPLEAS